jgi:uncharacterized protein with HEPN domain
MLNQRDGYDAVDYGILWQIITDDLPALLTMLEAALSSGERSGD